MATIRRMRKFIKGFIDILFAFIFLKVYKRIDRLESNTAYSDLQFFFLAARDGWGKGGIIEIGSYQGKSTVALAWGSKLARRERVLSIDPHSGGTKEAFFNNLRSLGVEDYVVPAITTSESVSRLLNFPVRLIFIDGNHEYEFVKKDILLWKDLVIAGGIIALHDYTRSGVSRAIDELIRNSDEFIIEGTVGCSLLVSKRTQKNRELFETVGLFNGLKQRLRPWRRRSVTGQRA